MCSQIFLVPHLGSYIRDRDFGTSLETRDNTQYRGGYDLPDWDQYMGFTWISTELSDISSIGKSSTRPFFPQRARWIASVLDSDCPWRTKTSNIDCFPIQAVAQPVPVELMFWT